MESEKDSKKRDYRYSSEYLRYAPNQPPLLVNASIPALPACCPGCRLAPAPAPCPCRFPSGFCAPILLPVLPVLLPPAVPLRCSSSEAGRRLAALPNGVGAAPGPFPLCMRIAARDGLAGCCCCCPGAGSPEQQNEGGRQDQQLSGEPVSVQNRLCPARPVPQASPLTDRAALRLDTHHTWLSTQAGKTTMSRACTHTRGGRQPLSHAMPDPAGLSAEVPNRRHSMTPVSAPRSPAAAPAPVVASPPPRAHAPPAAGAAA
jgi:hypothetical protein